MRTTRWLRVLPSCLAGLALLCGALLAGCGGSNDVAETKRNPADGAVLVWVPGGTFTMGSIDGVGYGDEHPAHQVTLTGFWLYRDEVTVAQYRAFCADTSRALPDFPTEGFSWAGKSGWDDPALQQHPIVNVSWNDVDDYADWAGAQLPTEAQWEYAARGIAGRNYSWGGTATVGDPTNGWDATKCANSTSSEDQDISTWPVGSFAGDTSWRGARDLTGNVMEWCADWYNNTYPADPVTDPTGPVTGDYRVVRGGSWDYGDMACRNAFRGGGESSSTWNYVGFRCVVLPPKP